MLLQTGTVCKVTQRSLLRAHDPSPIFCRDGAIDVRTRPAVCLTEEPSCKDEARVGQKGGHAYIWAPIGSRPRMVRDNRHVSTYIFGAICPERAVGAAMIMPYATTEAMNQHLVEISAEVAPGAHAILVCDG